jgi:tripartite ATP-independent transporter DctP family solute receptor
MSIDRRRLLTGSLVAALTAPFVRPSHAAGKVRLRISSSLMADANSSHFLWFDRFRSVLAAAVGDAVTLNYFPNNQLGKESDVAQQVRSGAVDMMISGTSIWATITPQIGVLDLGYLFSDAEHVGRSLDGAAGRALTEIMALKASVRILGFAYSLGARNVYTRAELGPDHSLTGVKIRVLPVPNFIATLEAMGAVATPIPLGEVYMALQTGLVDGVEQDSPTVLAMKFYEVARHCFLTRHIYNPVIPVINQAAFARLDPEIQRAVTAAAADATIHQRGLAADVEARAFVDLKKQGLTVAEVDRAPFQAALAPAWDRFVGKYPDVRAVIDAIRAAA